MPSSPVGVPPGDSVLGLPDSDSGNSVCRVVGDSANGLLGAMVGDSVGALLDARVGDSVGSVDGEALGAAVVGDELGGGMVSSLGSGDELVSGAGVEVGEGVGDVVGVGLEVGDVVGFGLEVGDGVGVGLEVGDAVGFGRGDSLAGTVAFGGALVGFGSSTSMSCPFWLSVRGSPESRMGSAAMVVRRESIMGFGCPGMMGRKFRGSFHRPLMMTSK